MAFLSGLLLSMLLLPACGALGPVVVPSTSVVQEPPSSSPTPEQLSPTQAEPAAASPVCSSPATLTPALTEGPYFKANSPERSSLIEANTSGKRLILTGYVLTADCQPVAHALLDFWQADANGQYDNAGYILRGHQFTDQNGYYQLTTVIPGLYPGRTEHIHFKVQAPDGPILTSQLFFPGLPNNESDQIFDPALVIHITQESDNTVEASYNFIIAR